MNFCNFAKVILSRCTRDNATLQWWQNKENNTETDNLKPIINTSISSKKRHENYQMFMDGYPKMQLDFKFFEKRIVRIQNYMTQNKYWKNCNMGAEKSTFISNFSLLKWTKLGEDNRKTHQLENCLPCSTTHIQKSSLHKSTTEVNVQIRNLCEEVADNLLAKSPPNLITAKEKKQYGDKAMQNVINVMKPVMEEKLNTDFTKVIAKTLHLSPKKSKVAKRSKKNKLLAKIRTEIETATNEDDVDHLLSSGKSYAQSNRERMSSCFLSKIDANLQVQVKLQQEKSNQRKPKLHHGNFRKYQFDRERYIEEMKLKPTGSIVNWTSMARKYKVTLNKKEPTNGGQVMFEYAKSNGINVYKFNPRTRISGRDFTRRIRRSIKKIPNSKISVPTPRPLNTVKTDIKRRIENGEINIGEKIVPKVVEKQEISSNGDLQTKTTTVYGRKIPLTELREQEIERFNQLQILRYFKDEDYDNLTEEDLITRYDRLNESKPTNSEIAKQDLKKRERTRHIKLWHDHSDILNHPYICFMISYIYDPANFLTDDEYKELFPHEKPVSVQTLVERPSLYILGQSGSSDKDQMMYNETRLFDIQNLQEAIYVHNIPTFDNLRVFSGDGPARQFESGQQRGGNFSCICGVEAENHTNLAHCYQQNYMTLDERRQLILSGKTYMQKRLDCINPLSGLLKSDLDSELQSRGIPTLGLSKSELISKLHEILHGIQRPPALMTVDPTRTSEEINCQFYEILGCEPLHDLTNIVQNIIVELPSHLDSEVQKEYEKFKESTIGDKNQIKGSDARLYAIKLARFTSTKCQEGKVNNDVVQLVNSLVEIISICYSNQSTRCQKQILRLYNLCFIFALLCFKIIPTPKKMTSRKFYGSHFHSVTVHIPETARLFCVRSTVTENEERSFGQLRRISENTTNRQPDRIIDNAVMRFQAQQNSSEKLDSLHHQESIISKQANLLPAQEATIFPSSLLRRRCSLVQAHLSRIADFLDMGEGVWWRFDKDGDVIFSDGPDNQSSHPEGPPLHHFRQTTFKIEKRYIAEQWKSCEMKFKNGDIDLPLLKLKTYDENGKMSYTTSQVKSQVQDTGISRIQDHEVDTLPQIYEEVDFHPSLINEVDACPLIRVDMCPEVSGVDVHPSEVNKEVEECPSGNSKLKQQDSCSGISRIQDHEVDTLPQIYEEVDVHPPLINEVDACPLIRVDMCPEVSGVDVHPSEVNKEVEECPSGNSKLKQQDSCSGISRIQDHEVDTLPQIYEEVDVHPSLINEVDACPLIRVDMCPEVSGVDVHPSEVNKEVEECPSGNSKLKKQDGCSAHPPSTKKRKAEDDSIKEIYHSFIKVLRWSVDVETTNEKEHDTTQNRPFSVKDKSTIKKPLKRKLFQSDTINSETDGDNDVTSIKKSRRDVIHDIVGDTKEFADYEKYRRIFKQNPTEKCFHMQYQQCEAKLQIQVSKRRSQLKEIKNPTLQERQYLQTCEELLKRWGIYYY